jgi:predicted RecA/RadA family phage recombinase
MSKNQISQGVNVTVPDGVVHDAVVSGEGLAIGSLFGIVQVDALADAEVVLCTTGVWSLPKTSALAIAFGDVVYFHDGSPGSVDKTDAGGLRIGVAVSNAANPSPTVEVRLDGVGTLGA